jgi:hypothetical protein
LEISTILPKLKYLRDKLRRLLGFWDIKCKVSCCPWPKSLLVIHLLRWSPVSKWGSAGGLFSSIYFLCRMQNSCLKRYSYTVPACAYLGP